MRSVFQSVFSPTRRRPTPAQRGSQRWLTPLPFAWLGFALRVSLLLLLLLGPFPSHAGMIQTSSLALFDGTSTLDLTVGRRFDVKPGHIIGVASLGAFDDWSDGFRGAARVRLWENNLATGEWDQLAEVDARLGDYSDGFRYTFLDNILSLDGGSYMLTVSLDDRGIFGTGTDSLGDPDEDTDQLLLDHPSVIWGDDYQASTGNEPGLDAFADLPLLNGLRMKSVSMQFYPQFPKVPEILGWLGNALAAAFTFGVLLIVRKRADLPR